MNNPFDPFIARYGAAVLDGGLATELERRGADLNDSLWSAKLLIDDPDLIRQVHTDYYWAGADCCVSAGYQASIPGFKDRGYSVGFARHALVLSYNLVKEARDAFWAAAESRGDRLKPLVAVSIGPYGAYLADGSEYTGKYDIDEEGLYQFHMLRWLMLATEGADLMACETVPSIIEARALGHVLDDVGSTQAWISFSCRDGSHISDGTPFAECVDYMNQFERIVAIGINCTAPRYIPDLIRTAAAITTKPIIVYPNSGEVYDPVAKQWGGESEPSEFGTFSREWRKLGATVIGGCCRTTPAHIRQIRDRFRSSSWEA
jgi:homocysteine S-methyltransferase